MWVRKNIQVLGGHGNLMCIKKKLMFWILSIFLVVELVQGFGVSADYWDGRPLAVYPGETREVSFALQNMVGGGDVMLEVELSSGWEIATLVNESQVYFLPFGTEGVLISIILNPVPSQAV